MLGDDENFAQLSSKAHMRDIESDLAQLEESVSEISKQKPNGTVKSQCLGSLMNMDLKDDMFLVGDIFMRKYYTVFDRDNDRIGLAKAVHNFK